MALLETTDIVQRKKLCLCTASLSMVCWSGRSQRGFQKLHPLKIPIVHHCFLTSPVTVVRVCLNSPFSSHHQKDSQPSTCSSLHHVNQPVYPAFAVLYTTGVVYNILSHEDEGLYRKCEYASLLKPSLVSPHQWPHWIQ